MYAKFVTVVKFLNLSCEKNTLYFLLHVYTHTHIDTHPKHTHIYTGLAINKFPTSKGCKMRFIDPNGGVFKCQLQLLYDTKNIILT